MKKEKVKVVRQLMHARAINGTSYDYYTPEPFPGELKSGNDVFPSQAPFQAKEIWLEAIRNNSTPDFSGIVADLESQLSHAENMAKETPIWEGKVRSIKIELESLNNMPQIEAIEVEFQVMTAPPFTKIEGFKADLGFPIDLGDEFSRREMFYKFKRLS